MSKARLKILEDIDTAASGNVLKRKRGSEDSADSQEETTKVAACKESRDSGVIEDIVSNPFVEDDTDESSYCPPTTSEDSTDSVHGDGIKYKVDWFVGPGDKETVLGAEAHQWIVNDINVSRMLLKYRKLSVVKACSGSIDLSSAEILSLNHIFLLEEDAASGVRDQFDQKLWALMFGELKEEFVPEQLTDADVIRCNQMAKMARNSFKDCKTLLKSWQRTVDDDDDDIVLKVFQAILAQLPSKAIAARANEDTFVHKFLAPIISPFFADNELFECVWANDTLEASSNRKRGFDPSLRGRKPDFVVHTSMQSKAHLLVAEFKSAKRANSSGKELWNDLVKLGNEMKDSVDKIVNDGVQGNAMVCGLLAAGFQCDLFVMDLKYSAVYRMLRVGRFYVHRDRHDFGVLPAAIELLLQTKNIVTRSAELCVASFYNALKDDGETPPPEANGTRSSFHTPMRIPIR